MFSAIETDASGNCEDVTPRLVEDCATILGFTRRQKSPVTSRPAIDVISAATILDIIIIAKAYAREGQKESENLDVAPDRARLNSTSFATRARARILAYIFRVNSPTEIYSMHSVVKIR